MSDAACEHLLPWWCTPYYLVLTFGLAVAALAVWLRTCLRERWSRRVAG